MKSKIVVAAVVVSVALVTSMLPAEASTSGNHTTRTTTSTAARVQGAALLTSAAAGAEVGDITNLAGKTIAKLVGPSLVKQIAEKAGSKALSLGANFLLKMAGIDTSGQAEVYARLDAIKAQLEEIKVQIDEVQKSVNALSENVLAGIAQQRFDALRQQVTYITAGYGAKYLQLVTSNKRYFEAWKAANGNKAAPAVKDALATLQTDRYNFYLYYNQPATLGAWRGIHGFLVDDSNSSSIIAAKAAVMIQRKRYLTSADSQELRNLYYGLQAEEALAFNMVAEASIPCADAADCEALKGSGAPGFDNYTALNSVLIDYQNASVMEARQLPPMIPVGVIVDNVGGGGTNRKQEWVPQPGGIPSIVPKNDSTAYLNEIIARSVDPLGSDRRPVTEYALPTKQQLTDLLAVSTTTSAVNRGFTPNTSQTLNAWLSTLDSSAKWQAIATRKSPRLYTGDVYPWRLLCSGDGSVRNAAPDGQRDRKSMTTLVSGGNKVAWDVAQPSDFAFGTDNLWIYTPSLLIDGLPASAYTEQCTTIARQRLSALPAGQILATRNTGDMRQDYMSQVRAGRNIAPDSDLSYQNLASLNLGALLDPTGVPLASDTGLRNTNLTGAFLQDAVLTGANLSATKLADADLTGVSSGGIRGRPASLPSGWILTANGYLVGKKADLSGADLTGVSLVGADLTGVDFTGTNLTGANLMGAKLAGVTSGGITGQPVLPAGWRLVNGYLIGPGANLTGLDLTGLDLSGADLTGVQSGNNDCTGCTLPTGWKWTGRASGYLIGPGANLTGANLAAVDLTGLDLSGTDLTGVRSGKTNCTGCTLPTGWTWTGRASGFLIGPGANLEFADLTDLDLSGANLRGARLVGADLLGADLTGAILTGVDADAAELGAATLTRLISGGVTGAPLLPAGWRLVGGYLMGPDANLTGANLTGFDLTGANLRGANLGDATMHDTRSGGVDCTGCTLPAGWIWTGLPSGYLVGPGATVTGANLTGLDLTDADLAGVTSGGVIGKPKLPTSFGRWDVINGYIVGPNVNLAGANLSGVNLRTSDLRGVTSGGITGTPIAPTLPTDWRLVGGYLVGPGANLAGATLPGAALETANLTGADFTGANLFAANLAGATMANVDFENANLVSARLAGGWSATTKALRLPNSVLTGADLAGVDLSGSDLTGVTSGGVSHGPTLPPAWRLFNGYLVGAGATLTGANLARANFSGMRLSGALLSGVDFTGATLTGVDLSPLASVWNNVPTGAVTLSGATLAYVTSGGITGAPAMPTGWRLINGFLVGSGANLTGANLSGANVTGMNLASAVLTNAVLTNAVLTNAVLTNVVLTGATVTGATFLTDNDEKFARIISGGLIGTPKALSVTNRFRVTEGYLVGPNTDLTGAVFTPNAQLGISLSGTNFTNATLTGVNLNGAYLNTAILAGARLTGANLTGANMSSATLTGVISGGILGRPALPAAWKVINGYLIGPDANLTDANLRGADLTGVDLIGADLRGADLSGANFTNADLTRAKLGGAILTGAIWSNTTCPSGIQQSTQCPVIFGGGPASSVTATADKRDNNLLVNIDPDLGGDAWTFSVEQLAPSGRWETVGTYLTDGSRETRTINLPEGTYRIVVPTQNGYQGSTSPPVTLTT
jgi:uncharacterized protein YjbI with pentapeptide repeats